jgi:hypothetical protein
MQGGEVFRTLLSFLSSAFDAFPDPRNGKNKHYTMRDIGMSAFAVFFGQSPSFLAFQRLMRQAHGIDNTGTMFGVQQIPTDNQIRNVLDTVDPKLLRPAFKATFDYLQNQGVVESYRSFANTVLIAIDGTGYFYSEAIHCPFCHLAHHRDGRVSYTHSALMPAMVKPKCPQVIALEPEFILPQKGHERQDCEREAAKRWVTSVASRYSSLGITLLGDDIYSCQPLIKLVVEQEMDFIFVAKPRSHKYLYEELQALGEIEVLTRTLWTGKKHQKLTYRYINGVPLKDGADSIKVNWVEMTITNEEGKVIRRFSFVTNHLITAENVENLVEAGRCRWKIENEDFNTLKTKGYHFEHNFGHGERNLSETLLSLNILAFLFHTVLELLDERCGFLRKTLPRRDTFFQHFSALIHYACFASWESLLKFMVHALKEGPRPPPDSFTVIS